MVQRPRSGLGPPSNRPSPSRRIARPKVPLAEPWTAPHVEEPLSGHRRRRNTQITGVIADGTGRSEGKVPLLVVSTVVSALVAGGVTASFGAIRILDFVRNA